MGLMDTLKKIFGGGKKEEKQGEQTAKPADQGQTKPQSDSSDNQSAPTQQQ